MQVYVFHSGTTRVGLTRDIAGANLPRDLSPWTYFNTFNVDGDALAGRAARLVTTLREKGYILVPAEGAQYDVVRWLKPL